MIVIPAKFKSSRLERKNFRNFYEGASLLQLATLRCVQADCGTVIVSSENPLEVKNQLKRFPLEIRSKIIIHGRKTELARDPATILDVIDDCISSYASKSEEYVISVLPSSPFNSAGWIKAAKTAFENSSVDRLISICNAGKPPFNAWMLNGQGNGKLIEYAFPDSPFRQMQSTRCPETFFSNGCVSIYKSKGIKRREFIKTMGFQMPAASSVDIDHYFEFEMAQKMFPTWTEDLQELSPIIKEN